MKKVALISGVAGGIGTATARVFCRAGWHVVGTDRKSSWVKSDVVAHFIPGDIADPDTNRSIFDEVRRQEGRLDTLINNAGVQIVKNLVETAVEEWDETMSVNVRSAYLAIKHAYPLLCQNGGSIVNVSSVHAMATSSGLAAYAASKGALVALTRAAAIELAPDHIRVNTVLPGAVDTEMLRAGLERDHIAVGPLEQRLKSLSDKHILGRVAQPEEIGRIIFVLADGEQSSFMTGQTVIVDGGATARLSTE
jgi:glucose 1-dehydrogenase